MRERERYLPWLPLMRKRPVVFNFVEIKDIHNVAPAYIHKKIRQRERERERDREREIGRDRERERGCTWRKKSKRF